MGSGEMGDWIVGEIPADMEVENVHKCGNSLLKIKATIPLFHYSKCEAKATSLNTSS